MSETKTILTKKKIILLTNDNKETIVDLDILSISNLIHSFIILHEDEDEEQDENEENIQKFPLPTISKNILDKIIEFCRYYKEHPMDPIEKPIQTNDIELLVDSFYASLVSLPNTDSQSLFELTLAANYLDIPPLLDLCNTKIATFLKDSSAERIRENLCIPIDMNEEEENKILTENRWSE